MTLEAEDLKEYHGRNGDFTTLRKLVKPGETVEVVCVDIARNHKTKFPIKDKDYGYRVTLEMTGVSGRLLLDLNGTNVISQFVSALYPQGESGGLQPCRVKITRRTERKLNQSEVVVERVGDAEPEAGEKNQ